MLPHWGWFGQELRHRTTGIVVAIVVWFPGGGHFFFDCTLVPGRWLVERWAMMI